MSSTPEVYDTVVIGGGIVGLAVAHRLSSQGHRTIVLEKEPRVAMHQSGRNSGVLHSGLYYKPGSLKATTCRTGKAAMEKFCQEEAIPWERCGKVVVATSESELSRLQILKERGRANGVELIEIDRQQLLELEPQAGGIAALHVPETGIASFGKVCERLREKIHQEASVVDTKRKFLGAKSIHGRLTVETSTGPVVTAGLVNCAGLHCDTVFRECGGNSNMRIIPFRGEYYDLKPTSYSLVRNLIYPVPDPSLPFLGVHFTRMAEGGVECGPNAVLALAKEGYSWRVVNFRELFGTLGFPGFRKMSRAYLRTGFEEVRRSLSKPAFVKALQRLLPNIRSEHLVPGRAGVRAQAVRNDGVLVDDFLIERTEHAIHVLNAPSPAATASLAIADYVLNEYFGGKNSSRIN